MADLHETVAVRSDVEIDVAEPTQRIVGRESAEGHDRTFGGRGRFHGVEDVCASGPSC